MPRALPFLLSLSLLLAIRLFAADPVAARPAWSGFVETNFPFFSSVLDARNLGAGWPSDNLTPRGIIMNLGHGCWACFDVDLLRVSAIWSDSTAGVTPVSMSQGSYQVQTAGVKAPPGQAKLPRISGTPWLANGLHPGWMTATGWTLRDPREPGPDPKEVGRGPLPADVGRFKSVRFVRDSMRLEYEVAGVIVREAIEARLAGRHPVIQRRIEIGASTRELTLVLGRRPTTAVEKLNFVVAAEENRAELIDQSDGLATVRVRPSKTPTTIAVAMSRGGSIFTWDPEAVPTAAPVIRWPEIIELRSQPAGSTDTFTVDNLPLPNDNPWRRNVRVADVAFFKDGRAVAVTFDGDVWSVNGLADGTNAMRWRRFASGLHEPLNIVVRDEQIFVLDRNGLWRLHDRDGNGEADEHELFSNAFTQTAETREFVTGLKVAPDGAFIISKGGQQDVTVGRHNGTVLRLAPDGASVTVLGWGLRMPFIGVHPRTGLVTASDQQGNYVPATPLHVIEGNHYHGFQPLFLPKERHPAPIAEPATWIPHPINASGAAQTWLVDAKMGALNDALIHFGYYRPEAFRVLWNRRAARPQAAVVSLTRDFAFPPLTGTVNPADGLLYVAGFQIWGSEARQVSGLARIRPTGTPSTFPNEVAAMNEGVLLRFDTPLNPAQATDAANFSAERWNYRRTANYGSPHYKLDGSKGQDALTPSSAYLSKDRRAVFVGLPDMRPAMQMRVGWSLLADDGRTFSHNVYLTAHELTRFDPVAEGFVPLTVNLAPRPAALRVDGPVTPEEGRRVSELMGCVACHSTDGSVLGKVGPSWKGIFGSRRTFADKSSGIADEAYLRQAIKEPAARIVSGYDKSDTGMPSYEGVITDAQIEALVAYLKTLR